jgi:hypothetical protein
MHLILLILLILLIRMLRGTTQAVRPANRCLNESIGQVMATPALSGYAIDMRSGVRRQAGSPARPPYSRAA